MSMWIRVSFVGFLFLGLFAVTGCQNNFTHDRWEMVAVGSADKTDVKMTLGAPQEKPFKDLWWYYKKNKEAKIYFDDKGMVKAKKWFDMKTGDVETDPAGWVEK